MLRVLISIKTNPYGQPLYDFHEVATRILRRQKAEQRTSRAGEIFYCSLVVAIECVNVHANELAGVHVFQLSFLEICRHPDVIKRHNREQTLSWLDSLFSPAALTLMHRVKV